MTDRLSEEAFAQWKKEIEAARAEPLLAKADKVRGRLFRQQLAVLVDEARRKTVLTPRRAGKSTTAIAYLVDTCLRRARANVLFITLTLKTAKKIVWIELKRLNAELELGLRFNNTELIATFPNGSLLTLAGAETEADIEKFRGQAYDLVVIDECASFPTDLLDELIREVLNPALADRRGTLLLIGTPGAIFAGTFWKTTGPDSQVAERAADGRLSALARPYEDREAERWRDTTWAWSAHTWTKQDNTALPHLWEEALGDKAREGWADDNPIWIREYLGRWAADGSELVYKYDEKRNGWEPRKDDFRDDNPFGLPGDHAWVYILGVDLGFDADFALQVGAYSETCPDFYQVYEFSEPKLIIPEIARAILDAEAKAGEFEVRVGDRGGLGKQIFATLEKQYGIQIDPAEKQEKRDHIELLNSDLVDGRCKILKGSKLEHEMKTVPWTDSTRKKESDKVRKDNCDAWLYTVTRAQHHFHRPKPSRPLPGSPEHEHARQAEEVKKLQASARRKAAGDDDDWGLIDVDADGWGSLDL